MNAAEFPMFGRLRHDYIGAVQAVDGYLTTAAHLHAPTDPDRAATIEACRIAAMKALHELTDLIANVEERKRS